MSIASVSSAAVSAVVIHPKEWLLSSRYGPVVMVRENSAIFRESSEVNMCLFRSSFRTAPTEKFKMVRYGSIHPT
jgi:hypothetical protein